MKNVTIYTEVSQAGFMEMTFREKPEGDEGARKRHQEESEQRLHLGESYVYHILSKEARVVSAE